MTEKNAMGYDPSKFTDHDPLIGDVVVFGIDGKPSTDPTKAVDAITHTVHMPPGKKNEKVEALARDIYQTYLIEKRWPSTQVKGRDFLTALRAAHRMYERREFATQSLQKPVRIFERGSGIPLKERALHRFLVLWRKRARKLGQNDTDKYRRSTEALIAQHARVNNLNTEVKYRVAGDRSHLEDKIDIDLSAVKTQYAGSATDAIKIPSSAETLARRLQQ